VEPPNLHFGTVDFERESVAAALARLPFRPDGPAVFAWLGVTMYLTRAAIDVTWRAVCSVAARGSEIVFDFYHPDALSETAPPIVRTLLARTRALGEPIITGIDPDYWAPSWKRRGGHSSNTWMLPRFTGVTSRCAPTPTGSFLSHTWPALGLSDCGAVRDACEPAQCLAR
jgi:O-methyltransferase involved in polyketide biosynthesis